MLVGTIKKAITPGIYLLRDDQGRGYRAASQDAWRRGDRVVVIDGQIVGRAGAQPSPVTYLV